MKKLKFVCFSLMSIFLLFFGVFSFGVGVKAAFDDWDAPESAKNFVDFDGKGIRLYFLEVHEESGFFVYADMVAVKNYVFDDGELEAEGLDVVIGRDFFDSDLIDGWITYYLDEYGDGNTIPERDRTYVYFNVVAQCFMFEFHGSPMQYATYWIERCSLLYDEMGYDDYYNYGYDVGYYNGFSDGYNEGTDEGYDEGYYNGYNYGYNEGYETGYTNGMLATETEAYERGFADGQESKLAKNNEAFYQGIEKWLVPAIITVIALGGFVTIAARKRRDE